MSEGVIHDIGYRHYDGARLGSAYGTRALFVFTLRGIFGLGRPARSKVMPFFLVTVMLLPAVVSIVVMTLMNETAMTYTSMPTIMQAVPAIFLASQAPTAVAPDLRYKVLPLYLSRPVGVTQYVLAKYAAMVLALFLLMAVPLVLMFVGELLVDMPDEPLRTQQFAAGLFTSLVLAVLLAGVGLLLASLTPRRGLGVASVIAVYMLCLAISGALVGTFESVGRTTATEWAWLINPFFLVDAVRVWLFGGEVASGGTYPPGPGPALIVIALIAFTLGALFLRYRKAAAR